MKIVLPGSPVVESENIADPALAFFDDIAPATVKHSRKLRDLSRAGDVQPELLADAAPDDVVELEFADGIYQWLSVARLQEEMAASGHRSTQLGGVTVPLRPIGVSPTAESRDIGAWVLKGLKVIGFDPVKKTADLAERKIVGKFEGRLDPPEGLYALGARGAFAAPITQETEFDAGGAALIFLHGTASSITGSFSDMAETWEKMSANYPGRIYGFQHRTLSVSPVTNALALARLIPDGATLHLVSHSRGGLVGELLCIRRISKEQLEAFRLKAERRDKEADVPAEEAADRAEARAAELAALKELSDLLEKRQYKIERFVRVACPARGTILASERLDLYLSLITSAIGLAVKSSPYLQPIHEFLKAVTIEVARRRTRPEGLPGFEAQMPESPLIHLLNNTGLESQADLAVIAGDIQMGDGIWNSLRVLATNLFYLEKHDLVVNTEAMYAGIARAGGSWVFFDQGSDVSHFNYFKTTRTRDRLLSWLAQPAGQNIDSQFTHRPRGTAGAATSRSGGARDIANLPALFVLPGIMGTRLKDTSGLLWLDQQRLSAVGMKPLALNGNASGVETDGIVQLGYQRLEEYFSATHNVVLFAYDWRRSLAVAAADLATEIKKRHDKGEVVRIIAHSMGGLVARAMIAAEPKLWKAICANNGRLIQLGTPNKGSFVIPRILWGVEPTVQMLAMLDPRQTKEEICAILAGYPGVIDMLPETDDGRFFDPAWWKVDRAQLASPSDTELTRAVALRAKISAGDTSGIVYVAGTGEATPTDLAFESNAPIWRTTPEGDGTVPYSLGQIAGIEPYYAAAVHGDLADEPKDFDAYAELLNKGATDKLPKTPPRLGPSTAANEFLRGREPVLFPTEEELLRSALGRSRRKTKTQSRILPALNVTIRHGDLRRSQFPLVVGHYLGDKIVHAEQTLDKQLDGRLSRQAALGLYPGAEGSVELFLAPQGHPPGALVVGLGHIGEISMEKVRRAIMDAALRYAVHLVDTRGESGENADASTGLSALLIGTNGGRALRVIDSVTAIVEGILDANKALDAAKLLEKVCFDTLHFVELYETVAAQALYSARNLSARLRAERGGAQELVVGPYVQQMGRGRIQPPLNPYETGWWPRIEITGERNAEGKPTGGFRFSIPTSRAGMDERITQTQAQLIKDIVEEAIVTPRLDAGAASNLFELLVPNSLKPRLDVEADNAVIVVDKDTARIPWEMLARQTREKVDFLGLRMGLLRQFKSSALQQRQPDSRSLKAVVIGDTDNPFAPLDGAVREGEAVLELLKGKYDCDFKPRQNFSANFKAIYAHDYRILHIAAHGQYDPDPSKSGVVLGKDKDGNARFFTSAEIRQMPAMPELVFLNCCHLGKTDLPEERLQSVNMLAASVAEELINKGVRVVVAAGWAVDDGAAEVFARRFYSEMLAGACFGDAVRHARIAAYDSNQEVNTWAAYQCYGPPDYKLEGAGGEGGIATSGRTKYIFGTRNEFLHAIRDLHQETVDGKTRTDKSALRADLEALELSLPTIWLDGEILYELGMIWGALGDFVKAAELLRKALLTEDGLAPFRTAEQLANFEDRAIAEEAKGGMNDKLRDRWRSVQERLEQLNAIAETRERLSLLAGSQKRRALAAEGKERDMWLKKSAETSRKAYNLSVAANAPDPYPGLNWLTLAFLAQPGKSSSTKLKRDLEQLMEVIDARPKTETERDIWKRLHKPDALLLLHLIRGDLHTASKKGAPGPADLVKAAYANVFDAGTTPGEIDSATKQLNLIKDALEPKIADVPQGAEVLRALEEIRKSIVERK